MTLMQFVQIALAVILITLVIYVLIDRICKCVEYCSMYKLIGNLIGNSEEKIGNLTAENIAAAIDKETERITKELEKF